MTGIWIAINCIVVLLLFWLLVSVLVFCMVALRIPIKEPEPEQFERLKNYGDTIRDGVKWLLDRQPEEVEITSYDGLKLRGLFLQREDARCTAILMHGYRSDYLSAFAGLYELLYESGCNLLVPWQRAHGKSEGKIICMGLKEKRDCADWARYIEARLGSEMPIVLHGTSMGSATVFMAAGEKLPKNVRGLVADCGFTSPWDEYVHLLKTRLHLPACPLIQSVNLMSRLVAGLDFRGCPGEDALRGSKLPLLLIHGEEDRFVPPEFSRRAFSASAAEDKELLIVPGANHGVSYYANPKLCGEKILAFYDRVLG